MSLLDRIKSGPQIRPHFVGLYGPGGVGKTSFGASAPKPVFIEVDDGSATFDVGRYPVVSTWGELNSYIDDLLNERHDYETAVIDTINGCEPLLWAWLCKEHRCGSIEDVDGGYGKGYTRANEVWAEFWRKLKRLRMKMNVIVLGHSRTKTIDDVMGGERFDRYHHKMHDGAAALFHESVDCMFFATYETDFRKEKGSKKAKAFGSGKRVMFTEERPWFAAKSRFDIPFEMPLSWDAFFQAAKVQKTSATHDELAAVFVGLESESLAFLIDKSWLAEGQSFRDLPEAKRKIILNRPADFCAAVKAFSIEKQQPETETTA
jgi:hypothetical protein